MKLNDYQAAAKQFACYHNHDAEEDVAIYPFLALSEEIGEVNGKIAKSLRGDRELDLASIAKELGDVLWNLSECARQIGCSLEAIAQDNLSKLQDRKDRDVIKGDGDNR